MRGSGGFCACLSDFLIVRFKDPDSLACLRIEQGIFLKSVMYSQLGSCSRIIIITVLLLFPAISLCGISCQSSDCFDKRGLLVVPGLGRIDRLKTVVHNLKALDLGRTKSSKDLRWDCLVYVYANRSDQSFWSSKSDLDYVKSLCSIVENPGKKVTENLYLLQPATIKLAYKYVFILLDDIKIQLDNPFNLARAVQLMECNQLTVLSPVVRITLPSSYL